MKAAWDQLPSETIINCFCSAGIHDFCNTPPSPTDVSHGADDFDIYFQELLEVPWDEYLAYDDELETCSPPTAPDTGSYLGPEYSEDQSKNEPDQDQDQQDPPPSNS